MPKKDFIYIKESFLDFTDFFNLVLENCTINTQVELFRELVGFIYDESDKEPKNWDNEAYDILSKRKAFPPKVRKNASMDIVDRICEEIGYELIYRISNKENLKDRLLFRVREDNIYFNIQDYEELRDKNKLEYIMAYVLVVTIATSSKSCKYSHIDDDQFRNYQVPVASKCYELSTVEEDLLTTSLYIEDKYSKKEFTSIMLSNGKIISDSVKNDRFDESFSILTDSLDNSQKLQELMFTDDNLLIIGEGGIGKTTALFSYIKECRKKHIKRIIPIYIRLSDCSTRSDQKHMILSELMDNISFAINGKATESFKDIIDEFNAFEEEHTKYVLLLDGFNEITTMNRGKVRYSIANEINTFLDCKNVRVVLTTRESDFYNLRYKDFVCVRATGISDSDVEKYLRDETEIENVDEILENKDLLQYLRIPLFLWMFTSDKGTLNYTPKTRGEILYNYYNGANSTRKINEDIRLILGIMLDFILPQVGFYMTTKEIFHIDSKELEIAIKDSKKYIDSMLECNPVLKARYINHTTGKSDVISEFEKLSLRDIILLTSDVLGVLYEDGDERLYFCHQYIRDYFSALYCVNDIVRLSSLDTDKEKVLLEVLWDKTIWSDENIRLICEIMNADEEYIPNAIINRALAIFKNRRLSEGETNFTIENLVSILAYYNDYDLSDYDFSNLDLRDCRLSDINFSNPYTHKSASFAGTLISENTFATEKHLGVKSWTISDEEHFIASISHSGRFKLWNISNQKCIYTAKIDRGACRKDIDKIEYIESIDTLIILSSGYLIQRDVHTEKISLVKKVVSAWTYEIKSKTLCRHRISTLGNERILYFGYDYSSSVFLMIADNATIYFFRHKDKKPYGSIKADIKFTERICQKIYPSEKTNDSHGENEFDIHILDENKILYIEEDSTLSNIHVIKDEMYKFFDNNDIKINELNKVYEKRSFDLSYNRYINIFIYDRGTREFTPMHLENSEDSMATILLSSKVNEDIIHNKIAISKDRKKIALNNQFENYIYDINDGDYVFKSIGSIIDYRDPSIKYCNSSEVITLYTQSSACFYNVDNEIVLNEVGVTPNLAVFRTTFTQNYCLQNEPVLDGCTFNITNLYTKNSNMMSLAHIGRYVGTFVCGDNIYILYNNGTLIGLDRIDLSKKINYNICPKRNIFECVYSDKRSELCVVTSPIHDTLLLDKTNIMFFNVDNGRKHQIARSFPNIIKIAYTEDSKYILAFTLKETILISTSDYGICDSKDLIPDWENHDIPVDIICNKDEVEIVYSKTGKFDDEEYYGIVIGISIADEKINISKKEWIPRVKVDELDKEIFIKSNIYSSICRIKAINPTESNLKYYREGKEKGIIEKSLNEWVTVYLHISDKNEDAMMEFLFKHNKGYYVSFEGNKGYVTTHAMKTMYYSKDGFIDDIGYSYNSEAVFYDEDLESVYLKCEKDIQGGVEYMEKIKRYDLKKKTVVAKSQDIYPYMLTGCCDFKGSSGNNKAISIRMKR